MRLSLDIKSNLAAHKKLERLQYKETRKILSKALREGGKMVLSDVKANMPERSGALKRAMKLRVNPKTKKPYVRFKVMNAPAWYGLYVEVGSAKQAAQHILRRSAARLHDQIYDMVEYEIHNYAKS